ncbi:MAG TPA: lysophospholipid acyltransferase family protein [Planctomycetota bacterium]|nr:lysophospholipid acyltransferase family protein [Planctomycetota bacterium]
MSELPRTPDLDEDAAPATGDRARREPFWSRGAAAVLAASFWTLGALPPWLAYALADLCATPWALYWSITDRRGQRSKGYWRNVAIAFRPGAPLGATRPRWHLWRWSRHLAWLAVDFCRLRQITRDNLEQVCDLSEYPRLRTLYDKQQGIIFATGHVGLWDVAGWAAGLLGMAITSVYRPSPVPSIDRVIAQLRTGTGQTVVAKHNVIGTLKKVLAQHEVIGLLCDSGYKKNDVFAPFLGVEVATVATPALLHLATRAPIAVVTVARTGRWRFHLHVWDIIEHPPSGDRKADVLAITTRINQGLGRGVVAAPAQWFWQSRRFRHRPAGEVSGPDGLPPLRPGAG